MVVSDESHPPAGRETNWDEFLERMATSNAGDELGAMLRPDYVAGLFAQLVDSAGLKAITIRQLRHTHATTLLAAGVPPKVVQERLGHSSIKATMDVYSAMLPG